MRKVSLFFVSILFFVLSSCGTILKPYQIDKPRSDQLDVVIVILDSVGLFFLLIPGIVAYGLDYSNGTLFLPKGKRS